TNQPSHRMMYFEDYMEMIEGLPQEVLEKLTQIRQCDLALDNTLQPLGARIAALFARRCQLAANANDPSVTASDDANGDQEYADICEEFAKARGHSDEKLQLAKQLLETVSRLKRKLGMEVEKFKLELEADHAGVTSSIEDRLLREEDLRHHRQQQSLLSAAAVTNGHHDAALASLVGPDSPANSSTAASAAAAATMAVAGHRRPHSPLSSVGSSFGDVATPLRRGGGGGGGGLKRNRTSFFSGLEQPSLSSEFDQSAAVVGGASSDSLVAAFLSDVGLDEAAAGGVGGLSGEDNSRYCICHDVSHGEMIACENPACPFEWFHFACVGLTVAPRGSWYCPRCKSAGVKRQRLK
ncbi:hypothetical protein BOX15_Mlig016269g2, partial [Macrostomum lignano]